MKPSLKRVENFPYPYYQYGSKSSTDVDVIIVLPKNEMPRTQEERKQKMKQLMLTFNLDWNAIFVVIKNGVLTDTIYTKSWIDSLNNAFLKTYEFHTQLFEIPVKRKLKRNKILAIYKAVRTVLTMLTRTHLRSEIKPILKGIHPFDKKIKILQQIDFSEFIKFNQKNTSDEDIWKVIAFYIAQNRLLIRADVEVYSKEVVIEYYPELYNFIFRKKISSEDKEQLTKIKNDWLLEIIGFGEFISGKNILSCNDEKIDMIKEISID